MAASFNSVYDSPPFFCRRDKSSCLYIKAARLYEAASNSFYYLSSYAY